MHESSQQQQQKKNNNNTILSIWLLLHQITKKLVNAAVSVFLMQQLYNGNVDIFLLTAINLYFLFWKVVKTLLWGYLSNFLTAAEKYIQLHSYWPSNSSTPYSNYIL